MPGFAINQTDPLTSKNHKAEFNRKHRWRVSVLENGPLKPQDWLYLSKAARPNYKIEEAPVHHNEEVAYFAGKRTWETLPLEFYDAIDPTDISQLLYDWVNVVTNIPGATTNVPAEYKKELQVEMLDGDGTAHETWKLYGAWPIDTNWNDLDYSSSDIQLVSVTVRFDRAEKIV